MPEKIRCNGNWTEARFKSFIVSLLRKGTYKWGPRTVTLAKARTARGKYKCNGCKKTHPLTKLVNGKRVKNILVDHIDPVVDPKRGFIDWNTYIERMFVEEEGLQVLCKDCHDEKTALERKQAKERS